LTSAHQNDLKTQKKNYFEVKKKIKYFQIFLKTFLKHKNKHRNMNAISQAALISV